VKKLLFLALLSMMSLALFAPVALAQDDDDGGASSASAVADDDDDGAGYDQYDASATSTATAAPLPDTGGPALLAPFAGLLLLGSGILSLRLLRRD